jgi:hypothetical protein
MVSFKIIDTGIEAFLKTKLETVLKEKFFSQGSVEINRKYWRNRLRGLTIVKEIN